jgi:Asp-tRNA(Asn)/Glu-tRNA(Gln) amidotransferase B subunit
MPNVTPSNVTPESSYIYTDEHKQYRNNLAQELQGVWQEGWSEEELAKFSPEQLKRLQTSSFVREKKREILEEAKKTEKYKNARIAKAEQRKENQAALVALLQGKGISKEFAKEIIYGVNFKEILQNDLRNLIKQFNIQTPNYSGGASAYLEEILSKNSEAQDITTLNLRKKRLVEYQTT